MSLRGFAEMSAPLLMTFPKRDQQAHLADLRFNKKKFLLVPGLIIPHSHAIMRLSDLCDSEFIARANHASMKVGTRRSIP